MQTSVNVGVKLAVSLCTVAIVSTVSSAATHSLQPYAYVKSQGVNWIDTGYCAKPQSRYFIDYRLVNSSTRAQGIFGDYTGSINCALYIPNYASTETTWYYKNSGISGNSVWNVRDTKRRKFAVSHPAVNSSSATLREYDGSGAITKTPTHNHDNTSTTTISLFALKTSDGSYKAGDKEIYCFEAADNSSATTPDTFLAPTQDANGKAGFYDVIGGMFHGEANASASKALIFQDGIGNADDYKFEGGVFSARFHAYASDDSMGGVKFGEDAASGMTEAWVARGANVTLAAVPQTGYVFVGWTGDTWAITSGSAFDDSVTVASGTAVQLLAHFSEESLRWTGAANDGEWFTPGNWIDASGAPVTSLASGDKFTFFKSGAQTVDYNPTSGSFAVGKVIFAQLSGPVTVKGDAMASLGSVVCANGAENVMSNTVTFAAGIDVTANSGHIIFAGGAMGTTTANHKDFYGKYTITATGEWKPPTNGSVLKSGSELNLPNGIYYDHNNNLTIESGATMTVKEAKTTGSGVKYLVNKNSGVFKSNGDMWSSTTGVGGYMEEQTGGGVYVVKRLRATGVLVPPGLTSKTIVGSGGIFHGANGYVRAHNEGSLYFGSYADWPIYCNTHDNTSTTLKGLRKVGSSSDTTVTFDTTDYYENTVRRTITAESGIGGSTSAYADTFKVVVQGIGRFIFANTGIDDKDFAGGLTVKESATVAVRLGARPGRGAVTLEDTSTLEVSQSGTVTLGGNLSIADGAALGFNFTDRAATPILALASGKSAAAAGTIKVKIAKSDDVAEVSSAGELLTRKITSGFGLPVNTPVALEDAPKWVRSVAVVDGDIVLTLKSKGFFLVIK